MKLGWMFAMQTLLVFSVSTMLQASDYQTLGRYHEAKIQIAPAAADPLKQIVFIEFPYTVQVIGDAVEMTLAPTGYRLPPSASLDRRFLTLLSKPLPVSQRALRGSVLEILHVLGGEPFVVVRDPINRTLTLDAVGVGE